MTATGLGWACGTTGPGGCMANPPAPLRAAGPMAYNYWFAFVGNVLGLAGETTAANGWSYEGDWNGNRMFMLGWNAGPGGQDPYLNGVSGSYVFQSGNYDYVNGAIADWASGYPQTLPNSLYLSSAPSFFGAGASCTYPWPWVTPTGIDADPSQQLRRLGLTCPGALRRRDPLRPTLRRVTRLRRHARERAHLTAPPPSRRRSFASNTGQSARLGGGVCACLRGVSNMDRFGLTVAAVIFTAGCGAPGTSSTSGGSATSASSSTGSGSASTTSSGGTSGSASTSSSGSSSPSTAHSSSRSASTSTSGSTTTSSWGSSGSSSGSGGNADWPTFCHDVERSNYNAAETTLSPANAATLVQKWTFATKGVIEASATIAAGVLYIGSWDGYEYALNPASGALLWKASIDTTTIPGGCNSPWPDTQGVSSSATVQGGEVYVGGGGEYWYALAASDGGVLYKIFTGDNSSNGGYYNWASPLIANGDAYINISSFGNCPSVQGAVLQVSLSSQSVTNTFEVVPNGQQGGAIWSSPAYDAATNKVFVSTGSVEGVSLDNQQPYAQAILALDGTSLALLDSWQLPQADDQGDDDFGATPTLFTDAAGEQLIGCANKNGTFYTLDRNNLAAGTIWEVSLAPNGNPGTISAAAFDGTTLYAVGDGTEVYALDPGTGSVNWQQALTGTVLAPLAAANGLLVVADGDTLEVRATSTGDVLFSSQISNNSNETLSAAPSIANGFIYEGTAEGTLYAFGLP